MEGENSLDLSHLEVASEGSIQFYSYSPQDYSDGKKALTKSMPVFYNPIMEINRSITILAYQTFLKLIYDSSKSSPPKICDSMAASGIRSLRMLQSCSQPIELIINDLNPLALSLIRLNFELNHISTISVRFMQYDAAYLFHYLAQMRDFQDIIDIDPFGTPNIFIEPALHAIKDGGLIGITATDMPVLFGHKPEACLRKYGVRSLRSSFLKEVGLRILIYFIAIRAHPLMLAIEPQLSISFDHYLRVFIRIQRGKASIEQNQSNFGYMLWCSKCDWRNIHELNLTSVDFHCPQCSALLQYGGPLWVGPLHADPFLQACNKDLTTYSQDLIPSKRRLTNTFNIMIQENHFPSGYYHLHKICDQYALRLIKTSEFLKLLEKEGYHGCRTHIEPRAIKTDADISIILKILRNITAE